MHSKLVATAVPQVSIEQNISIRKLKLKDEKIKNYEIQLENLYKKNMDLSNEVRHLNMLAMTSNGNRNDSRNY